MDAGDEDDDCCVCVCVCDRQTIYICCTAVGGAYYVAWRDEEKGGKYDALAVLWPVYDIYYTIGNVSLIV